MTHYTELRYLTGYEKSGAMVDVRYILKENGMRYDLYSPADAIQCHILLPKGKRLRTLLINSRTSNFETSVVGQSNYVDFRIEKNGGKKVSIEILFE